MFADELKKFLGAEEKTRFQFAKDVGVDIRTIFAWLAGENSPSLRNAKKIQRVTGFSLEIIFSR